MPFCALLAFGNKCIRCNHTLNLHFKMQIKFGEILENKEEPTISRFSLVMDLSLSSIL